MKRGLKIFVFTAAMLLTAAGIKAGMHRRGMMHPGACSGMQHQREGMGNCHPYQHDGIAKPESTPSENAH